MRKEERDFVTTTGGGWWGWGGIIHNEFPLDWVAQDVLKAPCSLPLFPFFLHDDDDDIINRERKRDSFIVKRKGNTWGVLWWRGDDERQRNARPEIKRIDDGTRQRKATKMKRWKDGTQQLLFPAVAAIIKYRKMNGFDSFSPYIYSRAVHFLSCCLQYLRFVVKYSELPCRDEIGSRAQAIYSAALV